MANILTSKIQVPSLPNDTLILKDAEARQDLSDDLAVVTGNPLNFSTRSAQKANETVISLEPIQDLHGYDHPWPAGGGKNILPMTVDGIKAANTSGTWSGNSYVHGGITYTIQTDSGGNVTGINANGTATSSYNPFYISSQMNVESGKEYIINGSPQSMSPSTWRLWVESSTAFPIGNRLSDDTVGDSRRAAMANETVSVYIQIFSGQILSNKMFYPMIRLATETDPTFAPYTNYCPIDGRTETSLVGTNGKESTDPDYVVSNDLTISFGEKVYGGTVNLESGTVTVDRKYANMPSSGYGINEQNPNYWKLTRTISDCISVTNDDKETRIISDMFAGVSAEKRLVKPYNISIISSQRMYVYVPKADFATTQDFMDWITTNNPHICYELRTPHTIQLTPNEISLLMGVNNISTDGDSITLTYRDGKVATLADLTDTANNLQEQIDQNETIEDETTQLLYKLGVNNGLLFIEEV